MCHFHRTFFTILVRIVSEKNEKKVSWYSVLSTVSSVGSFSFVCMLLLPRKPLILWNVPPVIQLLFYVLIYCWISQILDCLNGKVIPTCLRRRTSYWNSSQGQALWLLLCVLWCIRVQPEYLLELKKYKSNIGTRLRMVIPFSNNFQDQCFFQLATILLFWIIFSFQFYYLNEYGKLCFPDCAQNVNVLHDFISADRKLKCFRHFIIKEEANFLRLSILRLIRVNWAWKKFFKINPRNVRYLIKLHSFNAAKSVYEMEKKKLTLWPRVFKLYSVMNSIKTTLKTLDQLEECL